MSNRIFCLLGKSSTGKDKLYQSLIADPELGLQRLVPGLHRLVPYTTRPIRTGEQEGREYHFVTEEQYEALRDAGKIAEERSYPSVYGIWRYFTVLTGHVDLDHYSYLLIGTLESYRSLRRRCEETYGPGRIVPLYIEVEDGERLARALARERKQEEPKYIEVEDGERLARALARERKQEEPKYEELCRRFLADTADFAPEKVREAGIRPEDTFENRTGQFDRCEAAVRERILQKMRE